MERTKIDGVDLEYEVTGTGEPVLAIDGAFITGTFRPLVAEPAVDGAYRFILYHRRGYGGSGRPGGPAGIAQQAADCRGLLRHLGIERAHIVGHSYGGAIALQLALDSSEFVQSLVLLEPALFVGETAYGYREALTSSAQRIREEKAETVLDAFLEARSPGYRVTLDRVLPGAFERAVTDAPTWFDYELPGLLDWRFGDEEAKRIVQPVLSVLGGASEALWSRFGETHRALLGWLPRAEGYVLPGATHFMQLEDPAGTANALAGFWARHPFAPAVA